MRTTAHTITKNFGFSQFILVGIIISCGLTSCGQIPTEVVGQDCGSVTYHGGYDPQFAVGSPSTETCFVQAYLACQQATMFYSTIGIDTVDDYRLTVQKSGKGCHVIADAQTGAQMHRISRTSTCVKIEQFSDGMLITGCGEIGDISIQQVTETPTPGQTH